VDYVFLKYKLVIYNGIYLALFLELVTFVMICYFWPQITAIIEEFKYQLLKEKQQATKDNQEYLQPKTIIKKQDHDPIEYQDL